ncbi:MAG: thioredoxin [Actinobacteria bacterium]|nr:thioredoxin [Actinomycetota bacterium]
MPMIEVTDQNFEVNVIEKSRETPVVVDLWAEWCGPCKSLGPILDKVIDATGGKVVGVKVDVDANPGLSQAFQVQSIPMVVAFKDGQVVDSFNGAQGEPAVQEFIDKLLPSDAELAVDALLEAGDEASLQQVLTADPGHAVAVVAFSFTSTRVVTARPSTSCRALQKHPRPGTFRPWPARAPRTL